MCMTTRNCIEFSKWSIWADIHNDPEQVLRQNEAGFLRFTPLKIDVKKQMAHFISMDAQNCITTLADCSCSDFLNRKLPCEHMYALAACLGLISLV